MHRKLFLSLILVIGLLVSSSPAIATQRKNPKASKSSTQAPNHGNANFITTAQLKDYLDFIASDELEGRDTPSKGLDVAARFIATNLSRWGLKPGGDNGTFFQKMPMRRDKIKPKETFLEINGERFKYGEDFFSNPASGSATTSAVYVGHGWLIKSKNINPYEKVDIKDKLVVFLGGTLPQGASFNDLSGKEGEDWDSPWSYAKKHGAKALIAVPSYTTLTQWEQLSQNSVERGRTVFEKFENVDRNPLPIITLSVRALELLFRAERAAANSLFYQVSATNKIESFELSTNKTISFNIAVDSQKLSTRNVIGILEGQDPVLKNEYVALGAHYDHVGINPNITGDNIYNGADDDGSGTVAILSIAEAMARGQRPKRSVLFVWHTGEEKGLLGSRYFTENPTVPLDQIVTQLNLDMVGRSKQENDNKPMNKDLSTSDEIYVIGSKMLSSELGQISELVNASFLNLKFNYRYDDPKDPNRFFYRSDHYNYARKGIPIIFYFDGVHEDYHRVSDSVDKIDFDKLEKVSRTVFATAWELANRPTRPIVDKQLPAETMTNEDE